jgi:hypothetical protein
MFYNYGFEQEKFFIDFKSSHRPFGNMREEHERRAIEVAEQSKKLYLSLSGGVDSQSILHSLISIKADFNAVFFYMPGFNDNEYENVKIVAKKYGINVSIVDFDVLGNQKLIEHESIKYDMPTEINILHRNFLKQLPPDCDFVQMTHDPFVFINPRSGNAYFYQGYYLPEISRYRILKTLDRTGKNFAWLDKPEFLLSILTDDVFESAVYTARYFDGNGATVEGKNLRTVDRWDYYIKPLIYGKYWKDELIYFPKFVGTEKIPFINGNPKFRLNALAIPYKEFIEFLSDQQETVKRFYENVPVDYQIEYRD